MQEEIGGNVIQEKLRDLFTLVHQCEEERNRSEYNLTNIAKTHERMQHDQKQSPYFKTKLKGLYNNAMQDAESEITLLKKGLDVIQSIHAARNAMRLSSKQQADTPKEPMRRGTLMKMVHEHGQSLPLWIGKRNESPPPLCGAIPAKQNYIANAHDVVAAKVKSSSAEDMWIVAEVVNYFHNTSKYEVVDIDEEQLERHVLSRKKVIPLPLMRANPETNPEALFPRDAVVLALYPQTTCFYPAIIKDPPTKPEDKYEVLFKDHTYPNDIDLTPYDVCQKYVISCKEGRKK